MSDIIGFFIVSIFMELIFWGICYGTGSILTVLISFGKWQAEDIVESNKRSNILKRSSFTLNKRDGNTYLGSCSVSLLGVFFWSSIILIIYFT